MSMRHRCRRVRQHQAGDEGIDVHIAHHRDGRSSQIVESEVDPGSLAQLHNYPVQGRAAAIIIDGAGYLERVL